MLMMDSWIGYSLDLIVDPIWIQMLRMGTNVRVGFKWAKVIFTDTMLRMDSWMGCWLDLMVEPIWIPMLRMDTNVRVGF